jgi:hypothetical protein
MGKAILIKKSIKRIRKLTKKIKRIRWIEKIILIKRKHKK